MKVAFVVNDLALSGGIGVVVQHARQLAARHGMDVTLVLARATEEPTWAYEDLDHLHVATVAEARAVEFDVAVSTWWETAHATFALRAHRYASFVQSLEDRFYRPGQPERVGASILLDLPVAFITEATWIKETLEQLRPDARVFLVRNGIDKDVFVPLVELEPRTEGPLRILVEGYAGSWFKGVNEAIAAVRDMREPHELTVVAPDRAGLDATGATRVLGAVTQREMAELYGEHDVLLKLSRVEGMYGPPLEGFHRGATVVTTEVTGHDEYVVHGRNGLVVDWDDLRGTARQLDLLARDRQLLHKLRAGALETAKAWPSWDQQGEFMAMALRQIRQNPPPEPYAHVARLLGDVRAGIELHRADLNRLAQAQRDIAKLNRIRELPGLRHVRAAKRRRSVQLGISATKKLLGRGG
ncbi:glycosyltransferase family 4 protein [Conexibacter sp. SYSU D00693]|uniref:glycosyltransferase family 4 protein n=1 Tax=Conexibacter sp. SYSU D00693 TaxID=2812560 RepID=UPI00196AA892|nr:glycosyltransferase family 4 protein [Conexibacter sp. SYSU D00693]